MSFALPSPNVAVPTNGATSLLPLGEDVCPNIIPLPFIQDASIWSPPNLSGSGNITVIPIIPAFAFLKSEII